MENTCHALESNWLQYNEAVENGHFDKASRIVRQALADSQITGSVDPLLVDTADSLANRHFILGNYWGAASLFRVVLETRTQLLGSEHPLVRDTRRSLAEALWQTGSLSPKLLASVE